MNVLTSYRMSMNFGALDYVFLVFYSLVYIITELRPVWWVRFNRGKKIDKPLRPLTESPSKAARRKTVDDVPGPLRLPFLGTKWIFSSFVGTYEPSKIHEAYGDMFSKYGPVVREDALGNIPVISLVDRADIELVFRYPSKFPLRPPTELSVYYRNTRPDRYINSGIVHEQGADWGRLRDHLTPELKKVNTVYAFAPELNVMAEDFCRVLRELRDPSGAVPEFENVTKRIGLESKQPWWHNLLFSVCMFILGRRMGFLNKGGEVDQRVTMLSDAVNGFFRASRDTFYGLPFWKFFPSQAYDLYAKSEETIYEVVSSIVDQAQGQEGETCAVDAVQSVFLSVLNGHGLHILEKKSGLIDFIAAGIHALANTMSFLLYLMAKHPEVQEILFKELNSLVAEDCPLTLEEIPKAKYLKSCVMEAYRVLPAAPCIARVLEEDMEIGGYDLKSGTVVLCHSWLASQKEENFTDAKSFRPERWMPENKNKMTCSPWLIAAFGVGKRSCPGKRFSEQELLLLLAKLVREFHIEYRGEMNPQFEFMLVPDVSSNFVFRDRKKV